MTCSRCSGFMQENLFLDMKGGYGEMWASSWHCVNCGHTHDPVIKRNRIAQEERVLVLSSGGRNDQDDNVHLGPGTYTRRAA